MNSKILLVEDDLHLGFLLADYLESEGFNVKLCRDGLTGLHCIEKYNFDLCIVDVMLPKLDGFSLAESIKNKKTNPPFIFLTAKAMKEDKMKGYALGAEDYITKPFDEQELLCKIQVILRRNSVRDSARPKGIFQLGDYLFDSSRQELNFNGSVKRLTEKETQVLNLLCEHQNRILRRESAVQLIYGKNDYFLGRSFDVFISRLRKHLKHDPRIQIENVFKVGFILNVSDEDNKN